MVSDKCSIPQNQPVSARTPSVWLLLILVFSLSACSPGRPPNVLLITLDTTRADFIGCYGKEQAETPNIDRLAAEGFLFEQAVSTNPVTQPSHSTILTGTYPMVHGVRDNGLFQLPDSSETLAEILKSHGYATGASVGGFPLTAEFGTSQGFDFYDDQLKAIHQDARGRALKRRSTWYDERPAGHVNDAILGWLRNHWDESFFVWLHYWDPHEPHIPPPPFSQLFAHDLYSGEIAYADHCLGTILNALETAGKLRNTIVIVVGDHGEGRREHGEQTHAFLAYQATLHVPMVVYAPRLEGGRRIRQRVGTVDLVPTVLDLLGFQVPSAIQGRSLVPLMTSKDEGDIPAVPYYAESLSPRLSHGAGELRVLFQGDLKYIHGPRPELYDLDLDPKELHDLAPEREQETQELQVALENFITERASESAAEAVHEISEETQRRLEALGYLGSTGGEEPVISEVLRDDGVPPQDRVSLINSENLLRRLMANGQYRQAKTTATSLVNRAPENPFYRAQLALACLELDQFDQALLVVRESTVSNAASREIFLQIAWDLCEKEQCLEGRQIVERLLQSEESPEAALTLARIADRLNDETLFNHAITLALHLDPEHLTSRLERGAHRLHRGDLNGARSDIEWAVQHFPAFAPAQLEMARLLIAQRKTDEALERFNRAISLAPTLCESHLEGLELLVRLGRHTLAEDAWHELKKKCRDPEFLDRAAAMMEEEK